MKTSIKNIRVQEVMSEKEWIPNGTTKSGKTKYIRNPNSKRVKTILHGYTKNVKIMFTEDKPLITKIGRSTPLSKILTFLKENNVNLKKKIKTT